MKGYRGIFLFFAVLAVIVSCSQPFAGSEATDLVPGSTGAALPPDQINDVARPPAGTFTFETVFPVTLNLDVNLFETDENGRVLADELAPDSGAVFVVLTDSEGNPIYSGKVSSDGTLSGVVILPSAGEDVTMTLTAEGFEDRSVVISDMVSLSEVNRTMSMGRIIPSDGSYLPRAISGLLDSDGDGVPDVYDAFPNDPKRAFKIDIPANGKLTVAFEDLFGRANAGDADYNDFVAAYSITETLDDVLLVTSITVNADAVTKLAGYNHRFGIRIDSFVGTATLTGSFIDDTGASVSLGGTVSAPAEILLFENSHDAVGKSANFTLTFAQPQDRRVSTEGQTLSSPPYNPFAIVINTGHDIHLIGREPLTELITSKNPDDTFVDGDGFPWALLVPDQWDNPEEGQRIEIPYPRFTLWRESGGEEHSDWYLHNDLPVVEPVVYVAGYYNDGTQDVAAYWVDGVKIDLEVPDSARGARADDLFVDGNTVYVAGWYAEGSTGNKIAAYWEDGLRTDLTTNVEIAEATGIFVDGDGVYVSGKTSSPDFQTDRAVYWRDGVVTELYSGAPYAAATEILVQDGAVYVPGFFNNGTTLFGAGFWSDGVPTDLSEGFYSQAWDIDVSAAGDVFVAGDLNQGLNYSSVYWVNVPVDRTTLFEDSTTGGNWSSVTGIDEYNGTVFTAGYYLVDGNQVAAYWSDITRVDLTTGSVNDRAWDIAVLDDIPFVVGTYRPADRLVAVLWADGVVTELYDSGAAGVNAEAISVFVVAP